MATTVGSHSISTFATPVNGGPLDANVVRGNDNTIKTAYVNHDADPGIHVQSSTLAARPAAGTAGRKWITEDSGVYTLWFDDGTNWHPVSSENVALTVLATENLAKGDVVKVTGWNNGQDLPEVAKVSSASDTAFAIITAAVTNGAMGYATNTGIVQDVNTNSFTAGTILYPNTSGGFTSTKPTSGTYQVVAYVLRQNTNNGVIFVEFSAPRIVESSSNTASTVVQRDASGNFSAGTITAGALTSTGLVTFASLKGTGATTVTDILNDSTMATASATTLATSSSIKTYVDNKVATVDTLAEVLANGNTTGANDIIVNAGQKIRTPLVAAQDGTSAITIANTTGALTLNTALADSNLATISTAGKVANSATTATSANTASAIVARDASGNFTAGTITAALTGNASTATALQTARTINGTSFDGTANITVTAAAGTLTGTTLASNVVSSSLTSVGTLANLTVTNPISGSVTGSSGSTTGNAATATALQTARNINGVSFNGTADITVTAAAGTLTGTTLASGVTASSLTSVGTLTSLTVSGAITSTLTSGIVFTNTSGGTNATQARLNNTGGDMRIGIESSAGGAIQVGTSAYAAVFGNQANYPTQFTTNGTARMTITGAGNVGIGTASPAQALDVRGNSIFGTHDGENFLNIERYASAAPWAILRAGSIDRDVGVGFSFQYRDSNGTAQDGMFLNTSGNLGLGVTPSAWVTTTTSRGIQFGRTGALFYSTDNATASYGNNYYQDGASTFKFLGNGYAMRYVQGDFDGVHSWQRSSVSNSSGAGAAVTWTTPMTLDASGNLLLGGATVGTNRKELVLQSANGSLLAMGIDGNAHSFRLTVDSGPNVLLNQTANAPMIFYTNNTERARITSAGFFKASDTGTYVNATDSYHELRNSAAARSVLITCTNASFAQNVVDINADRNTTNGTYKFLSCAISNVAEKMYVQDSGNIYNTNGTYGTISDIKHKQDVVDAPSQWDDLKAVRFRKYRMKAEVEANPDAPYLLGVVAQELEQVSPGLVADDIEYEDREVTDEDGNVTTERVQVGTTKTVKSSILLMKAAVALQEAMVRIEALEARLEALEA